MNLPGGTILGPFSREEWLEKRREGVGGSDCAAILGLSQFQSPLEVYESKVHAFDRDSEEHMSWGQILEPVIIQKWASLTDLHVRTDRVIFQSKEYPFLLHSPDGFVVEDSPVEGVEVKVIRSDQKWNQEAFQFIDPPYYAQVQHGLLCSGLPKWNVLALVSGQKLITREVFPDPEFQSRIIEECGVFWAWNVLGSRPPSPDGSESSQRALDQAWEPSEGKTEVPYDLVGELKAVSEELSVMEREKKRLTQQIESLMQDSEVATVDGVPVATWKSQVRNAVDVKALRADYPKLAEKYTKQTTSRVFRLK